MLTKKQIVSLIIISSALMILWLIPGEKEKIYDVVLQAPDINFSVYNPFHYKVIAPLVDLPQYFVKFVNYRFQLISWVVWIEALCLFLFLYRKKKAIILLKGPMLFFVLASYVIFIPYPVKHIVKKDPNAVIVDYQSHTQYSWDGMASLPRSFNFHRKNGFDAYAITEHDLIISNFIGKDYFKKKYGEHPVVIEGVEVYDSYGVHHLIYGLAHNISFRRANRDYQFLFKYMKNEYDAVFCPTNWWEQEITEQLIKRQFDSIEIINSAHRMFSEEEKQKAIAYAMQNNKNVIGTTDWHGWTYTAYLWTAVNIPEWTNLTYNEKQTALYDALRGKYKTKALYYGRMKEKHDTLRFIFEPFFGLYYYFAGIDIIRAVLWIIWIGIFMCLFNVIRKQKISYLLWFGYSIFLGILVGKYFLAWILVRFNNTGLIDLYTTLLIMMALSLLVGIIEKKQRNRVL
ncbi:MAG: PHP domain-containing protein [Elusimicrobiota bacterium]